MYKINVEKMHINKLKYFEKRNDSLSALLKKRDKLKVELKEKRGNEYTSTRNNLQDLDKEISDISNKKSECDYLFSVMKLMKNFETSNYKDLSFDYLLLTEEIQKDPRQNYSSNTKCKICDVEYEIIEGLYTCMECGITIEEKCISDNLTYKQMEEIDFRSKFIYEKTTYLDDWLKKFQAKDGIEISEKVLEVIKKELKKERITDYKELKEKKIREILKKLKLKEYYDGTINIVNILSERKPFTITDEIRSKIHQMFAQIQIPHQIFKPESRKNFISYPYFIKKFFLILGLDEIAEYYEYPKSQEKVQQLDEIFVKIVDYMKERDTTIDWKFYPSF